MPLYKDQTDYVVEINNKPQRIVSLVPSQTELLYDLGLQQELAGITRFCTHPDHLCKTKQLIGGPKNIKFDIIKNLQPDLIIANKEENVKEQIEALRKLYPVWTSNINTFPDALEMISDLGIITQTAVKAEIFVRKISQNFSGLNSMVREKQTEHLNTAYLIWKKPFMAAGGNTFIDAMLQQCGFKNIFADSTRYPIVTVDDIKSNNCKLLLLSSEPYPFNKKHVAEMQLLLPATKILLVDGEFFSWYGSRLLSAADYFNQLILSVRTMY